MVYSLARMSIAILLCTVGLSPAVAAPASFISSDANSLVQPAKTQCYTTEVCVRRGRPSGGHRPPCIEWATKTVCEPHVYNNPKKPSDSSPKVRVPGLISKPKPWQFQHQPALAPLPIGRAPSSMRR